MEHNVYICSWKRTREGYTLWVKSRPGICGSGSTYDEAEEQLIEAIHNAGGAMQAVLEFDKPLPKTVREAKYTNPELYLICGDDRFQTAAPPWSPHETPIQRDERLKWTDEFFESPVCRQCGGATSGRSEMPLHVKYAPPRFDGAFGSAGHEPATSIGIVSEDFLNLLTPGERRQLVFRKVTRVGRGRPFFELLGPAAPPFVAVARLPVAGWRCEACGHRTWGYWVKGLSIYSFVARSDLPSRLRGIFTVGVPPGVRLCVTAKRWQELVGKVGTRGFTSSTLGVVDDKEVVRSPELPKQ